METKDDLIGRTVHGSYAIVSKLGEGAMGRVYLAENVMVRDKKYAVKVLKRELTTNPNFMKQFYDEAAHQAQLSHPNIVQMTDYFKEGEDYFLVLEYVDGKSLADIIDSLHGPMPEKQALYIFKGILAGLDCAHQKAILHRDIKASNVMVDSSNRALTTDFGIARQAGDEKAANLGRVIGTPEYMSPEQFIDSDKIDHRSDIYSAGILLFEMLTGQLPFRGTSQAALKEQHLGAPLPNPRTINPKIKKSLAQIVLKATQKEPEKRFQGGLHFLEAIKSYERGKNWKIWGLSLSILIAAGVWYSVQNEKAVRSLATLATDSYSQLCREQETLKRKETGLRIATESGDSEMVEAFSRSIDAHKANMTRFFNEYARAFDQLTTYRGGTVNKVFSEPQQADESRRVEYEQAGEPERAKFWNLIHKDLEEFNSTGRGPVKDAMLQECTR
ncbi:MAG: serine/threonine protein kinase [Nitrosospira sp.]|nr:serine/threonine protein kinase [Nitrosospira sp.]